ncbi:MAG TPA: NADH-quinone oxidoreductase subunit L [Candidatus Bathyarchaeia archaeon]|nr:NADH-quinone oxidoreductase subunit L [Candidatus Bathyarchaeia archaeon]
MPLVLGGFTQSKITDYVSTLIALITLIFASALTVAYRGPVAAAMPNVAVNNLQLFSFNSDALSILFSLVVAFLGCVIIWYSNSYMENESGRGRYYFLMLFFVGGMLMLVNAANLVVFYIGWEIVGICSFLLVGFWYQDPVKNAAAKKVFFFTHMPGEALLLFAVGAYAWTGTVNINTLLTATPAAWQMNVLLVLALIAIFAKSAQTPFFSWLPSAMQGPAPVSALLHSAAMVPAGVYLAARLFPLFTGAWPWVLAIVGGFTLLLASTFAIRANDLKEVLAYSTITNLGFMFLAFSFGPIGLVAGLMQFLAHAFFKACLFLGAGAVDRGARTMDLNRLGGLSRKMPYTAASFTVAAVTLAGVPPLVGFVSKWLIYSSSIAATTAGLQIFVIVVLAGSVLSAGYIFRAVVSVFYGQLPAHLEGIHEAPAAMWVPQAILAAGCVALGIFAQYPLALITQVPYAGTVVTSSAVVITNIEIPGVSSFAPALAAILLLTAIIAGLILNEFLTRRPRETAQPSKQLFGAGYELPEGYVYSSGRHFLYQVTQPFERLRWIDPDYAYAALGRGADSLSRLLRRAQSGSVLSYATWIFVWLLLAGAVFFVFRGL